MILFVCFLLSVSPIELEESGHLLDALAGFEECDDAWGQARVLGRLIEEFLYAGDAETAVFYIRQLNHICYDSDLNSFWNARIAWSEGFAERATDELLSIAPVDPWLLHRAHGLAAVFSEDGLTAVRELTLSLTLASTARKSFWSALDLCSAYLIVGKTEEALRLSRETCLCFPGEPLAEVMYALCLQSSGRHTESMQILEGVATLDQPAALMARGIMEGFEQ